MAETECLGHTNNFIHLTEDLGYLSAIFDLGECMTVVEDREGKLNFKTGVKAYAVETLVRNVSVTHLPSRRSGHLRYGLSRTAQWEKFGQPTADDYQDLREKSRPLLRDALKEVDEGGDLQDDPPVTYV